MSLRHTARPRLRRAGGALALAGALGSAGCSLFRPHYQELTVQTSEPGATVYLNGIEAGLSPLTARVRRDQPVQVMARKPGFEDSAQVIDSHWNATAVLDLIGAALILVPGLGLFTPGSQDLDTNFITLQLFPQRPAASAPPRTPGTP